MRAGLDLGAGVGVDHHRVVRMAVAEGAEQVGRTILVERAGGVQVRHQHPLLVVEDLRGLAHEADPGDHQGGGPLLGAETGHLERVGHAAAGLVGQVLQVAVGVVMGREHRVLFAQQLADARLERLGPGRGPLDADRVGGHLDDRDGDVRQGFSFACVHIVSRRSGADCWSLASPGPGASVAPGPGRPCCSLLPQTAAKDNHFPRRGGPRRPLRTGAHRGSLRGPAAV